MALQATHGQGVELEPSEEMALAAMQIDKQTARQLLNSSLPVPSDVLAGHQKALAQIATKAHQARLHVSASCAWLLLYLNPQGLPCHKLSCAGSSFALRSLCGSHLQPMTKHLRTFVVFAPVMPTGGIRSPRTTILLDERAL